MVKITLLPEDNRRLQQLCGRLNRNLRQIEEALGVTITNRGNEFNLDGPSAAITKAQELLQQLYQELDGTVDLTAERLHLKLRGVGAQKLVENSLSSSAAVSVRTRKVLVTPHTANQANYLKNILEHDLTFGVGPAGTGKTFLAVVCAVHALEQELVKRIVLVRPAVEAGERLGFLPGSIAEKVDPYLRPLYDALYETTGASGLERLTRENSLEIAPLAFMRGRTLNSSFIILDESQNTTIEQMKMFLTRIGFNSKVVVTGDITQIDLAHGQKSGLVHAMRILRREPQISFNFFRSADVVRHPLVQRIVEAYARSDKL